MKDRAINPASRFQRALTKMRETPLLTNDDFTRMLRHVCDTKGQMTALRNEMVKRGAIEVETVVRLKEGA